MDFKEKSIKNKMEGIYLIGALLIYVGGIVTGIYLTSYTED